VDIDIGQNAREIVRRLSKVDLSNASLDAARVQAAFDEFFKRLGLSPRPLRWTVGPTDAITLASALQDNIVNGEVSDALDVAAKQPGETAKNAEAVETASYAAASAAHPEIWGPLSQGVARYLSGHTGAGLTDWRKQREVGWLWSLSRSADADAFWAVAELASIHATGCETPEARAFVEIKLPMLDAYEAGLWRYWVMKDVVLALPRPAVRLYEGRLHGDGVPVARWEAGECICFLNDMLVSEEVALKPARELDCRLILTERNAEVRREIVRKIGIERIITDLCAVCVDAEGNYELLLLDLGDSRSRPFLKMKNPSIGVYHIEGVHPDCRTVREALAWRNGTETPPSVLT
jgi:hypothetical protein